MNKFNTTVYTSNYKLGKEESSFDIEDIDEHKQLDFINKFQQLREEFQANARHNASLRTDRMEGMKACEPKKKKKSKPTKFIQDQIKGFDAAKKKYLRGNGKVPQFNFNVKAGEWHDSMLDREDEQVLNRVMGYPVPTQTYLPQQRVVERLRPIDFTRLLGIAFAPSVLALQKGIMLDKQVTVSSGSVGIHYLAMVTLLYDLIRALQGEWTIFQQVTPFYNYVRSFLLPKVIGQYSYSWDQIPEMQDLLSAGIPFELEEPGPNHVTVAWLTGAVNSFGQSELSNTVPNLTIDDLEGQGVQQVVDIWKRILQQSEGSTHLIEPFIHDAANESAAAFMIPRDLGVDNYNGYLTLMSETRVLGHHHFMGSLMLVDSKHPSMKDVRGKHLYQSYAGGAAYNWRLLNQDISSRKFNPKPRQVPLTSYFAQVLTMVIQSDVIAHDIVPKGPVTQPPSSFVGRLNAGDFIMAIASFVLKRYAMSNFLMMNTDSINTGTHKIGVGAEFLIDYGSVINGVLPMTVTEGMAALVLKPMKTGDGHRGAGEYDLMIPYIVMTGNKTNADPTGNTDQANPLSVLDLLQCIYPAVEEVGTSYVLGSDNAYTTLNVSVNHVAFFYGSAVNAAITNWNVLMESLQGYTDIGMSLGNIHEEPYTLADYTYNCTQFDKGTPWDDSATTVITGLTSVMAFDPDRVADQLTRILPVVYGNEFDTYISMTGETTSLQLNIDWIKQLVTNAVADVHPVAGRGSETSIMDYYVTARGEGGGVLDFFKKLGKAAIPAISMVLGGFTDKYVPGSGQIINNLGSSISDMLGGPQHTPFVKGLLKKGHINPYARIHRPLSEGISTTRGTCHITPKHRYY